MTTEEKKMFCKRCRATTTIKVKKLGTFAATIKLHCTCKECGYDWVLDFNNK